MAHAIKQILTRIIWASYKWFAELEPCFIIHTSDNFFLPENVSCKCTSKMHQLLALNEKIIPIMVNCFRDNFLLFVIIHRK